MVNVVNKENENGDMLSEEKDSCEGSKNKNKKFLNYSIFNDGKFSCFVKIKMNEKCVDALVDTGSEANILRIDVLENDQKIECFTGKVFAANKKQLEVIAIVNNVEIEVEKRIFICSFLVVKYMPQKCILGTPFLRKNARSIEFKRNCISITWVNTIEINSVIKCEELLGKYDELFIDCIEKVGTCKLTNILLIQGTLDQYANQVSD
jgi:predicted aspartyl protease